MPPPTEEGLRPCFRSGAPIQLGRPLLQRESVASTNDIAKQLAGSGAAEGTTVMADAQTQGRGRRGRAWYSRPGLGLYLSVILRPGWEPRRIPHLAVLGGVSAAAALDTIGLPELEVKWPNDILVRGRKIAGILIEPRLGGQQLEYAVIGVGVNVGHREADWPEDLRQTATSCAQQGVATSLPAVRDQLLREMTAGYHLLQTGRFDTLWAKWLHYGGRAELPVIR